MAAPTLSGLKYCVSKRIRIRVTLGGIGGHILFSFVSIHVNGPSCPWQRRMPAQSDVAREPNPEDPRVPSNGCTWPGIPARSQQLPQTPRRALEGIRRIKDQPENALEQDERN